MNPLSSSSDNTLKTETNKLRVAQRKGGRKIVKPATNAIGGAITSTNEDLTKRQVTPTDAAADAPTAKVAELNPVAVKDHIFKMKATLNWSKNIQKNNAVCMIKNEQDERTAEELLQKNGSGSFLIMQKPYKGFSVAINVSGEIKHVELDYVVPKQKRNKPYKPAFYQFNSDYLKKKDWTEEQKNEVKDLEFSLAGIIDFYEKGGEFFNKKGKFVGNVEYINYKTKAFNSKLEELSKSDEYVNIEPKQLICKIQTEQDANNFLLNQKPGSFIIRRSEHKDSLILSQNVNGIIQHMTLNETSKNSGKYIIRSGDLMNMGIRLMNKGFPLSVIIKLYEQDWKKSDSEGIFINNSKHKELRNDIFKNKIIQSENRQDANDYRDIMVNLVDSEPLADFMNKEEIGSFLVIKGESDEVFIIQKLFGSTVRFKFKPTIESKEGILLYEMSGNRKYFKDIGFDDEIINKLTAPHPISFFIELFRQGGINLETGNLINSSEYAEYVEYTSHKVFEDKWNFVSRISEREAEVILKDRLNNFLILQSLKNNEEMHFYCNLNGKVIDFFFSRKDVISMKNKNGEEVVIPQYITKELPIDKLFSLPEFIKDFEKENNVKLNFISPAEASKAARAANVKAAKEAEQQLKAAKEAKTKAAKEAVSQPGGAISNINREEAEKILLDKENDSFLIRPSSRKNSYAISRKINDKIQHSLIEIMEQGYQIDVIQDDKTIKKIKVNELWEVIKYFGVNKFIKVKE